MLVGESVSALSSMIYICYLNLAKFSNHHKNQMEESNPTPVDTSVERDTVLQAAVQGDKKETEHEKKVRKLKSFKAYSKKEKA